MPRKFELGDPVVFPADDGTPLHGVVVRYEYDAHRGNGRGRYVMLRRYGQQRLYGETVTRDSYLVLPDDNAQPNRKAASIVRNNAVILERGCSCNCCIHTALRASDVLQDGTFVWDREEE